MYGALWCWAAWAALLSHLGPRDLDHMLTRYACDMSKILCPAPTLISAMQCSGKAYLTVTILQKQPYSSGAYAKPL